MLITLNHAAELLACSRRTLDTLIASGALSVVRITPTSHGKRLALAEIHAYIEANTTRTPSKCQSVGGKISNVGKPRQAQAQTELEKLFAKKSKPRRSGKKPASKSTPPVSTAA